MPPTPITEETAKFDADDEHEDKQQNTSGSLRCEKSQTPSGHEPKTAKTRSKKLFHVTFGIHKKQSFGPQGHMPSLWNHRQFLHWNRSESVSNSGLGIQLQKPQQQQGSCPRHAKHEPQKLFHVTFRIHKKQSFGPREIWPWNTASESLEQQNTSGSLRCEKSQTPSGHEPKTAKTRSQKLFHVPLESTKNNLLGRKGTRPAYHTIVNSSTGIAPNAFRTLALEYTYKSLNSSKVRAPGMKTRATKTLSCYVSNPQKTIFWASR